MKRTIHANITSEHPHRAFKVDCPEFGLSLISHDPEHDLCHHLAPMLRGRDAQVQFHHNGTPSLIFWSVLKAALIIALGIAVLIAASAVHNASAALARKDQTELLRVVPKMTVQSAQVSALTSAAFKSAAGY